MQHASCLCIIYKSAIIVGKIRKNVIIFFHLTFSKNKKKDGQANGSNFFLQKNLNYSNIFQIYGENFSHELLARYLVRYGKMKRMFKYLQTNGLKQNVFCFAAAKTSESIFDEMVCAFGINNIFFFCEKFVKMGVILLYQQQHFKFPVPVSQFYGCTKPFVYGV